jgi:predicted RecB family endonuclease
MPKATGADQMGKFYLKMLIIVLGVGFCIFFGVDLATRGVERIQGPLVRDANQGGTAIVSQTDNRQEGKNGIKAPPKNLSKAEQDAAKGVKEQKEVKEPEPRVEIIDSSGVSRIGNKVGELLQIMAHYGIRGMVALFEAVSG